MGTSEAILATLVPVSTTTQVFARIALGAGATGLLLLLSLHFAKPELAPSWHMVSEYAIGPHGWLMTACFATLAIGCAALLVALLPHTHSLPGWIGIAFLLATVAGYTLAGLFPTDPISVSPENASSAARLHALSFAIGVPSFVLASQLISYALIGDGRWDDVRLVAYGFAHVNWLALGAMVAIIVVMLPKAGGFGPDVLIGWPNRLMFITYFGWLMATAWPLARPT